MVIAPQQPRKPDAAQRPDAAFVTQLLAARDNLAAQRGRRRATDAYASQAYHATDVSTVRRMPAGYRTSAEV